MNHIDSFLGKIYKIFKDESKIRSNLIQAIKEELGVDVKKEDVVIKNKTAFIKTSSASLKNEIFLRKKSILDKLKDSVIDLK